MPAISRAGKTASAACSAVAVAVVLGSIVPGVQAQFFSVRSGSQHAHCQIINGGQCVFDGYGLHTNNEECTIDVLAAGTISTTYFNISTCSDGSCNCDYLEINGQR